MWEGASVLLRVAFGDWSLDLERGDAEHIAAFADCALGEDGWFWRGDLRHGDCGVFEHTLIGWPDYKMLNQSP